jgi:transcriptional regulator with XRE-family HTH domain
MLRWARKRSGMSQAALAAACGMPQSTIARIERGTVVPRAATLVQLLTATGYELALEPSIGLGDGGEAEAAADADVEGEPDAIDERLFLAVPTRTRQALGTTRGRTSPIHILRRLRRFGVRFVLIGGLAEAAHGVPGRTKRLVEACHARDAVNVDRLQQALADLGAQAAPASLAGTERTSVATPFGRLVLDPIPMAGDDFEILSRTAPKTLVYTGLSVSLASLDDLIRVRRSRGRPEDRDALATLGVIRDRLDARRRSHRTSTGPG